MTYQIKFIDWKNNCLTYTYIDAESQNEARIKFIRRMISKKITASFQSARPIRAAR